MRRIIPEIDEQSLALDWLETELIPLPGRKLTKREMMAGSNLERRVKLAMILSERRYHCDGTICVHDSDDAPNGLEQMGAGIKAGRPLVKNTHKAVCGLAVESIEAWILGDPDSIVGELKINHGQLGYRPMPWKHTKKPAVSPIIDRKKSSSASLNW